MATPVRQQRKDVLSTPAAQRTAFLWRAANTLLPNVQPAASHLSVQLRQVCESQSTPLPKGAHQLSCARCETALLPGVNCRVLSGRPKKRPDNRAVLYKCSVCGHLGAFPNASRAVERSARAEEAAREQIERLASETGVVEQLERGTKRKRARGKSLTLKALAARRAEDVAGQSGLVTVVASGVQPWVKPGLVEGLEAQQQLLSKAVSAGLDGVKDGNGLAEDTKMSEAEALPELESVEAPETATLTNPASEMAKTVDVSFEDRPAALYSSLGDAATAQKRTEAPPLEVPLPETSKPTAHFGESKPETQAGVFSPAEKASPQSSKRPTSRSKGRSVLGASMAAKAGQPGKPAPQNGSQGAPIEESSGVPSQTESAQEGYQSGDKLQEAGIRDAETNAGVKGMGSQIGGSAGEQKQGKELEEGGIMAPAVEGTPAVKNGEKDPTAAGKAPLSQPVSTEAPDLETQKPPPVHEPESSVETSLRRSARRRGALNGSGAPPQKDETATSSKAPRTPSTRALRSEGGADLAEVATPLRRSARRAGSVEPDAKKAAATPGRRSGRNGGLFEPSSEPPVPRPTRRGGSRHASAEPEEAPQAKTGVLAEGYSVTAGVKLDADKDEGEGEQGRNLLGAIAELLESPRTTLSPVGLPVGVMSVLGLSSQETFVTATQESVVPGRESQSQTISPLEETEGQPEPSQNATPLVQESATQEQETDPVAQEPKPTALVTNPLAAGPSPSEEEQQATEPREEVPGETQNAPEILDQKPVDENGGGLVTEEGKKMEIDEEAGVATPKEGDKKKDEEAVVGSEAGRVEGPMAAPRGGLLPGGSFFKAMDNELRAFVKQSAAEVAERARAAQTAGGEEAPEMDPSTGAKEEGPAADIGSKGKEDAPEMDTEMGKDDDVPITADDSAREPDVEQPAAKRLKGSPEAGDLGPPAGESLSVAQRTPLPPNTLADLLAGEKELSGIRTGANTATAMEPPIQKNPSDELSAHNDGLEQGAGGKSGLAESADVMGAPARFLPEAIHIEDAITLVDGLLTSPSLGLGIEGSFPPTPTPEGPWISSAVAGDVTTGQEHASDDTTGTQPLDEEHEGGDTDLEDADVIMTCDQGAPSSGAADVIPAPVVQKEPAAEVEALVEQPQGVGGGQLASEAEVNPPEGDIEMGDAQQKAHADAQQKAQQQAYADAQQKAYVDAQQKILAAKQKGYADGRAAAMDEAWAQAQGAIAVEQEAREQLEARVQMLEEQVDSERARAETEKRKREAEKTELEAEKAELESRKIRAEVAVDDLAGDLGEVRAVLEEVRAEKAAADAAHERDLNEQRELKVKAYELAWQLAVQKFQEEALDRYESLRNRFEGRLAEAHTSANKAYATIVTLQRSLRIQQRKITLLRKTAKEGGSAKENGRKRRAETDLEGARGKKRRGGDRGERVTVGSGAVTGQMTVEDGVPKPAKFRRGEKVVSLRQGVPKAAKMTPDAVNVRAGVPAPKKRRIEETVPERKIDIDLMSSDEDEPARTMGAKGQQSGESGSQKSGQEEHVPYRMPRYPVGMPRGNSNIGFFKYGRVWRTFWKRGPPNVRAY